MPKKKRDPKTGRAIPDRPDKFAARCKKCGTVLRAATKQDLEDAKRLHLALVH